MCVLPTVVILVDSHLGLRDYPSVQSIVRHDDDWRECQESETTLLSTRCSEFFPGGEKSSSLGMSEITFPFLSICNAEDDI